MGRITLIQLWKKGRNKAPIGSELRELRHLARYLPLAPAGREKAEQKARESAGQPHVLMEQPNECAIKTRGGSGDLPRGEDRETGPTRPTCQLTLRILCLLLPNESLAI